MSLRELFWGLDLYPRNRRWPQTTRYGSTASLPALHPRDQVFLGMGEMSLSLFKRAVLEGSWMGSRVR